MQNRKEVELREIERYGIIVAAVKQAGYVVFCSLKAGNDSSYSFNDPSGKRSCYGWEDESSVYKYIYNNYLQPDLLNS